MGKYMDVHSGFFGVTAEQLRDAHDRDLAVERDEDVHFERAWLDPEAGKVFCLATGPSKEAVHAHPRARGASHGRDLRADRRGLRACSGERSHRCSRRASTRSGRSPLAARRGRPRLLAASPCRREITGNGRLKDVNGRSFCAFSGQEDLQWFTDDGDTVRLENPVKGEPGHAQNWGQIPKAVRDSFPADADTPGSPATRPGAPSASSSRLTAPVARRRPGRPRPSSDSGAGSPAVSDGRRRRPAGDRTLATQAATSVLRVAPSFARMCSRWALTVFGDSPSSSAISPFV